MKTMRILIALAVAVLSSFAGAADSPFADARWLWPAELGKDVRNKKWEDDFSPIDPDGCETDLVYTKAYLHHLFKAQELLAMQIASIHNLAFYLRLVGMARQHIEQGDFVAWKKSVIEQLGRRI